MLLPPHPKSTLAQIKQTQTQTAPIMPRDEENELPDYGQAVPSPTEGTTTARSSWQDKYWNNRSNTYKWAVGILVGSPVYATVMGSGVGVGLYIATHQPTSAETVTVTHTVSPTGEVSTVYDCPQSTSGRQQSTCPFQYEPTTIEGQNQDATDVSRQPAPSASASATASMAMTTDGRIVHLDPSAAQNSCVPPGDLVTIDDILTENDDGSVTFRTLMPQKTQNSAAPPI
ncbi:hypothetical protein IAT40_005024 [Kwoniella sp. CBS 6097]